MIIMQVKCNYKKVVKKILFICLVIENYFTFALPNKAGIAQLVEHDLAKVGVAGSSPVSRSQKEVPIPKNGIGIFH